MDAHVKLRSAFEPESPGEKKRAEFLIQIKMNM